MKPCPGGWLDNSMPIKKGDPGRPVISIQIGQQQFNEVICDIGSSFNIIPKVIYDDVLQFTTGIRRFAECQGHSAKPKKPSAKGLPSVDTRQTTLGEF